jgi:L-fuconolactonase
MPRCLAEPQPVIVDAHHHFWDPETADYPWMTGELDPIRRRFGPEDLAPLLAATGTERTILVQTRSSVDETREFLALAEAGSFVAGVVGWVDLIDAGVADAISAIRDGPGGARLVGIRHQVHDEPDPDWLTGPLVRRGLEAVGAAGLVYELLVRSRELPAALRVARDLPDIRFVIDHLAKPPIRDGRVQPWADLIAPFGELANVSCKVSGLVTEADWAAWHPDDVRPFVDHAIDVFGPERLIFGSDWPVCLLAANYERVHQLARTSLGSLSASERDRVFGGNAMRIYGLDSAP